MKIGERDMIGFSLFFDSMIRNLAKFSCVVKIVEALWSSLSESRLSLLFLEEAIVKFFMSRYLCASPSFEPYKWMLVGNGSPVSSAKAT